MEFFLSVLPWIIVILLVLIVLGSCIKVVPQSRAFVVERLGAFRTVWAWACISRSRCLSGWRKTFL